MRRYCWCDPTRGQSCRVCDDALSEAVGIDLAECVRDYGADDWTVWLDRYERQLVYQGGER